MKRRIIGLDPGLANTGYGIIDCEEQRMSAVCWGDIETSAEDSHEVRLLAIYTRLSLILDEYKPTEAEIEDLYFARNISSAMAVAEAKGVISLCVSQRAIPLYMYTPNAIKFTVTGTKTSDKDTVARYVALLLGLEAPPESDHASDALAGAITHFNSTSVF